MSYLKLIFSILLIILLNSCFIKTGYIARMHFLDQSYTTKDFHFIEDVIIKNKFLKMNESGDVSTDVWYYKPFNDGIITILLSYRNIDDITILNYIRIGDRKSGNKKGIKEEIDRIANLISNEVESKFGKGSISIEAESTTQGI